MHGKFELLIALFIYSKEVPERATQITWITSPPRWLKKIPLNFWGGVQ